MRFRGGWDSSVIGLSLGLSSSCALRSLKQTLLSAAQGRGTDVHLTSCCLKDVELPTEFSVCIFFLFFFLPFFFKAIC